MQHCGSCQQVGTYPRTQVTFPSSLHSHGLGICHRHSVSFLLVGLDFLPPVLMGEARQQQQVVLCWDTRTTQRGTPLVTGVV